MVETLALVAVVLLIGVVGRLVRIIASIDQH